ncbi:MAG: hypothetical protein KA120_08315, partial [Candidatus Goldbacteria bacterium]|nr:hypothetical protein [Candidatus Goldiibacteriota bacterium]
MIEIKSPLTPLFQRGEIDGINLPWPLFFKEGKLLFLSSPFENCPLPTSHRFFLLKYRTFLHLFKRQRFLFSIIHSNSSPFFT